MDIKCGSYMLREWVMKVLEKAGFKREGVLEANAFKDGNIVDQVVYAKIKE